MTIQPGPEATEHDDNRPNESEPPQQRRFGWVLVPVLVFGAMAVMFGFALTSGDPSKLPSALIGKPAPDVAFPGLKGLVAGGQPMPGISKSDLVGNAPTVVNFWASWCGPCVQEHPFLVALANRGIRVVGINYKDPAPGGLNFLAKHGNPFDRVGTDAAGRGAIEWGVYGMPETFVVDGDGRIVFKYVGPLNERIMRELLLPAIEKANASGN